MPHILNVYKPIGKTPLEIIDAVRLAFPDYASTKIAYAGRLDPMAEGVILLLLGDECKNRKDYEKLPKKYNFEALYGIKTDTYDALGLIEKADMQLQSSEKIQQSLKVIVKKMIGSHMQPYPPYSSARYQGKPLFYWAREGKIDTIPIPSKKIEIYELSFNNIHLIPTADLQKRIFDTINTVNGNFRQDIIKKHWQIHFETYPQHEYVVSSFSISCSSGTYVRSLVNEIGQKLNSCAFALSINRTDVGNYSYKDSLILT